MRLHRSMAGVLITAVAASTALRLSAQIADAPNGGTRETILSINMSAKPGAPFHATVATAWKRRLEDGKETTVYNHRAIARDSTGRVFQERRFLLPNGNTQDTPISSLEYYDPVRHEMTQCQPQTKHCMVRPWFLPVEDAPAPPAVVTRPDGTKITREPIGDKTIENLQVIGSHEITISPRLGEAEPSVKELWYSPRLGINLVVRRFEPRGGAEDFNVQSISLNEPDPRLFQVPLDYTVSRMVAER